MQLRARSYPTDSVSFVSRDTYQGDAVSPRSQQPYGYALQAPTTWTDPSGFCSGAAGDDDYTCIEEAEDLSEESFDPDQGFGIVALIFKPGVSLDGDCTSATSTLPDGVFDIDRKDAHRFLDFVDVKSLDHTVYPCTAPAVTTDLGSVDVRDPSTWTNLSSKLRFINILTCAEPERVRYVAIQAKDCGCANGRRPNVTLAYHASGGAQGRSGGGTAAGQAYISALRGAAGAGSAAAIQRLKELLEKGNPDEFRAAASYAKTYFRAFPEYVGKVWVHHAIPQKVFRDWPDAVKSVSRDALYNLRGVPTEINKKTHLGDIRVAWEEYYTTWRTTPPTLDDVVKAVADIDRRFGDKFLPPLR